MIQPIQLGWFINPVPALLPVMLVAVGASFLIFQHLLNGFYYNKRQLSVDISSEAAILAAFTMAAGTILMFTGIYFQNPLLFTVAAVSAGRALEGAVFIRLIKKIARFGSSLKSNSMGTSANDRYSGFVSKVVEKGVIKLTSRIEKAFYISIFTVIVGSAAVWVGIGYLAYLPGNQTYVFKFALFWTLLTLVASMGGVYRHLWPIRQDYPLLFGIGIIITISGAEIFNYQSIGTHILVFAVGIASYLIGAICASILWIKIR